MPGRPVLSQPAAAWKTGHRPATTDAHHHRGYPASPSGRRWLTSNQTGRSTPTPDEWMKNAQRDVACGFLQGTQRWKNHTECACWRRCLCWRRGSSVGLPTRRMRGLRIRSTCWCLIVPGALPTSWGGWRAMAGGTTQIGAEFVAKAAPDGYTLLLGDASIFTLLPNIRKLGYSVDSFDFIGGVAEYLAVIAVGESLPFKNLAQFVEHAKKNPGKLSFGSAGEASAGHVYGATLALDTGISVLHVPFRGSMDAVNALVAGAIDFIIDGAVTPMAKAGRVVPLATIYRQRHPELPNVPTLAETGVRVTIPAGSGWGLLAPKGTPKDVLARLSAALRTALQHKGIQEVFVRANAFASWQAPDEFRASLAAKKKM